MSDQGRILVVDDIPRNVRILKDRLVNMGYEVFEATNGFEALEKIKEDSPDLILLDVMMPKMDGYEVLEEMKAQKNLRQIPVIMITAIADLESVARCIELGADDYLTKPFNPVLLKARIKSCLEKKKWHDQEKLYVEQIEEEKKRSEELLNAILPSTIVEELKANKRVVPRRYNEVAIFFCDIVGFTAYSEKHGPEDVITNLGRLTEIFEELTEKHGLEKINAVGDQFMAAGGLGRTIPNPVLNCVKCGLEMLQSRDFLPAKWHMRIGIHIGPVLAGVVGRRKFLFGLWGDTVNVASRAQSHGIVDGINVTKAAWDKISALCETESRGLISVKSKGQMEMFCVYDPFDSAYWAKEYEKRTAGGNQISRTDERRAFPRQNFLKGSACHIRSEWNDEFPVQNVSKEGIAFDSKDYIEKGNKLTLYIPDLFPINVEILESRLQEGDTARELDRYNVRAEFSKKDSDGCMIYVALCDLNSRKRQQSHQEAARLDSETPRLSGSGRPSNSS